MSKEKEAMDITVELKRLPARTMILRVGMGKGEYGGEKFDIAQAMNGDIVWYFSKEERYYKVGLSELTKAMCEGREKLK